MLFQQNFVKQFTHINILPAIISFILKQHHLFLEPGLEERAGGDEVIGATGQTDPQVVDDLPVETHDKDNGLYLLGDMSNQIADHFQTTGSYPLVLHSISNI